MPDPPVPSAEPPAKTQRSAFDRKVETLRRKLKGVAHEIQTIYDCSKSVLNDPTKVAEFKGTYKSLERYYIKFEEIWEQLIESYEEIDLGSLFPKTEDTNLRKSVKRFYYSINTTSEDLALRNPRPSVAGNGTIAFGETKPVNLPKINLPHFDGSKITSWPKYRDTFRSLIHEDGMLTATQKFHYLVSSLSGAAYSVISQFPVEEANYSLAWDALQTAYDQKRILAATYLNEIISFRPMQGKPTVQSHQHFLSKISDSVAAFKRLNVPNGLDFVLFHLAAKGLDPQTRENFELAHKNENYPTIDQLTKFVRERSLALQLVTGSSFMDSSDARSSKSDTNVKSNSRTSKEVSRPKAALLTASDSEESRNSSNISKASSKGSTEKPPCFICSAQHNLMNCIKFHSLSPVQRVEALKKWKGCKNCLLSGQHNTHNCPSKWDCRFCHHKHNHMLHIPTVRELQAADESHTKSETLSPAQPGSVLSSTAVETQVILGTFQAKIRDAKGQYQTIRGVIDSGSHFSFMTRKCLNKLGFTAKPYLKKVSGIGQTVFDGVQGQLECNLCPNKGDEPLLIVKALIVKAITNSLPTVPVPVNIAELYSGLELADPLFHKPSAIDFLLGGDVFSEIWLGSPIYVGENLPKVFNSIFGLVVIGHYQDPCPSGMTPSLFVTETTTEDLSHELRRFWELEEPISSPPSMSEEDLQCERHFVEHHYRLSCGRYGVRLPFRTENPDFSGSSQIALKQFQSLESKLNRNHELRGKYHEFMSEYLNMEHMRPTSMPSKYVIPHHAIFKIDRGILKLRVVFNASSKTALGSLNDQFLTGPKLQNDIKIIILNVRRHRVVFFTDIVKMYRMILIDSKDRPYLHIFWRFNAEELVQLMELLTLTYGLSCAPFLALRVLKQLCIDEGHRFPKAVEALLEDSYIDDIASGTSSLEEAQEMKFQLIGLLKAGGFELSKWASNCPQLIEDVTQKTFQLETPSPVSLQEKDDESLKILGLQWEPAYDQFTYKILPPKIITTKRSVSSTIAKIFDPIGFLSPAIIPMKIMLQDLWKERLNWDDPLPEELASKWKQLIGELSSLSEVKIPRFLGVTQQWRVVGFADASTKAYCAAIYLQAISEGDISAKLVIAKTKVAPVKTVSVPRLELCAALLLARTYNSISPFLSRVDGQRLPPRFFSDSSVVLGWLNTPPYKLQTFVSHRVTDITQVTPSSSWRHVSTDENPADCGSRGLSPTQLANFSLWWNGPLWLTQPEEEWPSTSFHILEELPELKTKGSTLVAHENPAHFIKWISRFSSFLKLLRSIAWMKRSIHNKRKIKLGLIVSKGPFTLDELNEALIICVRQTQLFYFFQGTAESTDRVFSKFENLHPFMDRRGILRVGGRLRHSKLPDDHKHPILLPTEAHLTKIMVDHYHRLYLHPGPNALQALILTRYWIPSLRRVVRQRNFLCMTCYKAKAKGIAPIMGDLPPCRLQGGRAFLFVGIDFAGPFTIRDSLRRKAQQSKAYLCLFVCMASKALHLEVVSSLSTEAFLATLARFISRRGLPSEIFSDCGRNFVGAANRIKECLNWFNDNATEEAIAEYCTKIGIKWHFNPPHSPHFGGLWEAGVKSSKHLLHKIAGDAVLTFEELTTLFAKIEAILNSRPLCPLSSSPDENDYLSPGHFLVGRPLLAIPQPSLLDIRENLLSRWQLIKKMEDYFWSRWRLEYLSTLQSRVKWTRPSANLEVGDLVLLPTEANLLQWPMARVVQVHPGKDGVVRVVSIKTAASTYQRPACKVVPLLPLKSSPYDQH